MRAGGPFGSNQIEIACQIGVRLQLGSGLALNKKNASKRFGCFYHAGKAVMFPRNNHQLPKHAARRRFKQQCARSFALIIIVLAAAWTYTVAFNLQTGKSTTPTFQKAGDIETLLKKTQVRLRGAQ